jgi:DNA-binding HxlR family transcriptional regulator
MKKLRRTYNCPVELTLDVLGGKWSTVVLAWLKEAPHRYGELRARIPGLADKVLTQRLKQLESLGLVAKARAGRTAAGHAYKLTARGESLRPVLSALYEWGEAKAAELHVTINPPAVMASPRKA